MVGLLEAAVADMYYRAGQFGGVTRTFTPSSTFLFWVVLVIELAFLTAYQPERDLRNVPRPPSPPSPPRAGRWGCAWSARCRTRART